MIPVISIYLQADENCVDLDQMASLRSQLIWIYTVLKTGYISTWVKIKISQILNFRISNLKTYSIAILQNIHHFKLYY